MNQFEILMLLGCIVIFIIIIVINIIIYNWIVNRAVRKYVKSYLASKGYELYAKRFPGLFSSGAFKQELLFGIFIKGWPFHNTYVDVLSKNKIGEKKKTTVKISTSFLFIKDVKYKDYIS